MGIKIQAELLIFDLDGTLVDTGRDITNAVNFILARSELPPLEVKDVIRHIGSGLGTTLQECVANVNRDVKELIDSFVEYYGKHLLDNATLYPSVRNVLEHYKNKKKAVVSNKIEAYTRIIVERLGVGEYFGMILGRDSVYKPKPDPSSIIEIMTTLKVARKDTIMIGDGVNDILAAQAAGISCCAIGSGFGEKQELLSHKPTLFVDDLGDIIRVIK